MARCRIIHQAKGRPRAKSADADVTSKLTRPRSRFPPCSTTTSTKKLSAGAPISPMPLPQQGTRSQEYKRWNGSSCS